MTSTSPSPGSVHPGTSTVGTRDNQPDGSGADLVETPENHAGPDPRLTGEQPETGVRPLNLLLYSDDAGTRAQVKLAIGRRLASDLPVVEWTECATQQAVLSIVDEGGLDVLILDGEASPAGGLGLCKQLKDEIYRCPPVLVLTGRPQDAWLATWSRADAAVSHPLDPGPLAESVAQLARLRRG